MAIGYRSIGGGKEMVMVTHGWMTDHSCFLPLVSSLDLIRFTYVFSDQRGYGKSIDMAGPYHIHQVADDLLSLADELQWDQFHVVGHSMGGKVIQQMMITTPDRIKSAIAITPVPACGLPFPEEAVKLFSSAGTHSDARLEIFRMSTAGRYTEDWYQSINSFSQTVTSPVAVRAYFDSWANDDISQEIDGCSIPTLVITGENDADITSELVQSTYGKWLTNVGFIAFPGCGHYPMYETPLALGAECQRFLDGHV